MADVVVVVVVVVVVIDVVIFISIVVIDIVIAHLCKAQRVDRSVGGWRMEHGEAEAPNSWLWLRPAVALSQHRPLSTGSTVALNRGWRQDICCDPR